MIRFLRLALVSSLCLFVLAPPAQARAADEVVARDTMIQQVYALDGDLVYYRRGPKFTLPKRVWMRRVGGKLHRVAGIPRSAFAGAIGRDAKGRKVLTFQLQRIKDHAIVSAKWFMYDLARDRARRVRGLPEDCVVLSYSVWRDGQAYRAVCKNEKKGGVFVKQGKRTHKIEAASVGDDFVFRDGFLEGLMSGEDDYTVVQYMANGKVCNKVLHSSFGDATVYEGWYPSGLWLGGGEITWQMGQWSARPNFALLTAPLPSRCATPGPVGEIPFTPETGTLGAHTVDGRRIFYTDGEGSTLRIHVAPAEPSFEPPANDDFEHAQELSGEWPFQTAARVAYATVQPGEPLARWKHTVWYAFRPARSGVAYVSAGARSSRAAFGVYTGPDRNHLTEIRHPPDVGAVRIDAGPGKTYWIAIAASRPEPTYEPITLVVSTHLG